jgi:hypothetical protein
MKFAALRVLISLREMKKHLAERDGYFPYSLSVLSDPAKEQS